MVIFNRFLVFLLISIVSYLIGSIPNGIILAKIFFHKDPRNLGSHNIGGTNVGRNFGPIAGVMTIILDMLKLMIPFFICFGLFTYNQNCVKFMSENLELNAFGAGNTLPQLTYMLAGFCAMIGHAYSIYLKFSGGKIVSTYASFQLCMSYLTLPLFGAIFFSSLKIKKHVSESSIITGFCIFLFSWIAYIIYACTYKYGDYSQYIMWFNYGPTCSIYYPVFITLGYALLVFKHRSNIKRLKEGKESSISWMK